MPQHEFDIEQIYTDKLGYVALPYPLGDYSLPTADDLKNKFASIGNSLIGKSDILGRPYALPVFIKTSNDAEFQELPMPVISIVASKTILKTVVVGRQGTVKELISANDHIIRIKGIVVNQSADNVPWLIIENLYKWYELNEAIEISSELTEIFEVNRVVIENFKINPLEGKVNAFSYELRLVSDDDFSAILE